MNTAVCDVRLDVVSRLQHAERSAMGEWAKILDHAITLALNDTRIATTPGFLQRSVIRDARRILRRSHQSHPHEPLEQAGDKPAATALEESVLAHELEVKVQEYAARWGRDGEDCLAAMLAYEPCEVTHQRTGVPVRRLKYLRLKIREYLRTLLEEA